MSGGVGVSEGSMSSQFLAQSFQFILLRKEVVSVQRYSFQKNSFRLVNVFQPQKSMILDISVADSRSILNEKIFKISVA